MRDINQAAAKNNTTTTYTMTTLKDIKTNTLLDIVTHNANAIQELHNICDDFLTDMATFENSINTNTTVHLKAISIKIEAEMKETLNTHVINITVQLQEILTNNCQPTRTDRYVDLQSEKTLLCNELTAKLKTAKIAMIAELRQSQIVDDSIDMTHTIKMTTVRESFNKIQVDFTKYCPDNAINIVPAKSDLQMLQSTTDELSF